MHFSTLLPLALLPLVSAHFKLLFPIARGFDEDKLPTFPCGGQNSVSSNRTRISPTSFPLLLEMGHDEAAVEVLLGLGNDVGSSFNITLKKTFREEGLGNFCLSGASAIQVDGVDGLTAADLEGKNATLQVITNGDSVPAGGLYNCADITFTTTDVDTPSSCTNNTGVTAVPLAAADAGLNANETTAEGDPQESGSSVSSSTGSATAASKASTATASSTGGAALATAGVWGIMGAAVVGGLAAL